MIAAHIVTSAGGKGKNLALQDALELVVGRSLLLFDEPMLTRPGPEPLKLASP